MRIRKNLKLSSTSSSSSEDPTFHAHLCQLNQSPWDLIPFHSHSFYQFEYDDSSFTAATVTAANGDSIRAVDESSVASMMDIDEQAKLEDVAAIAMMELVDDNAKGSAKVMVTANNESSGGAATNRSYNKKPSAAAAARSGNSRASNNKARAAGFKKPAAVATAPSTNLHKFYYYSGFGPSWSTRRRGDRIGREATKNNTIKNSPPLQRLDDSDDVIVSNITTSTITTSTTTTAAPSTITDVVVVVGSDNNSTIEKNVEELDYELDLIDEEDEEDEEEDDNDDYGKKKRMRKPVKARSLKSLM